MNKSSSTHKRRRGADEATPHISEGKVGSVDKGRGSLDDTRKLQRSEVSSPKTEKIERPSRRMYSDDNEFRDQMEDRVEMHMPRALRAREQDQTLKN